MTRVLFVCSDNVRISPIAVGLFARMVKEARLCSQVRIDSAGIGPVKLRTAPDACMEEFAREKGLDISRHRARLIDDEDFDRADLILAMDWRVLDELRARAPRIHRHKLMLVMRFAAECEEADVPDPYQIAGAGFMRMFTCLRDACSGLLDEVRRRALRRAA